MTEAITVLKRNLAGEITWQYSGTVMQREPNAVTLEAFFNHPDRGFMGVVLRENDRFVETFYTDRWYNIFEVYAREDSSFKGWYCNVGYPAVIEEGTVSYIDLALDLWVSPEGHQTVLDEDEFEALKLDPRDREQAMGALAELRALLQTKKPPH
jgi:uncharacterized protein